jgi:hypothetical protein
MRVKVAARMRHVAESVLDALEQIPVILGTAQRVLNIYRDSEKLKQLSQTFYQSILAALGHILHYFRRKSSSKVFQVALQPASFQKDLLDKIEKIAKARNALNEEADLCHKEMQKRSYQLANATDKNSENIMREIGHIKQVLIAASLEQKRANGVMSDALDILQMSKTELRKISQGVQMVIQILQENQALTKLADQRCQCFRVVYLALESIYLHTIAVQPLDTAESTSDWESNRRGSVGTFVRVKRTSKYS